MSNLPYLIFLTIFFVPYAVRGLGILPGPAVLIVEMISGITFLMALVYCAYHKSLSVSPKYLVLFLVLLLQFMAGVIVNSMDPSVIFSGIRSYMKYIPFFLLPLVYSFSEKEMTGQFKLLVLLGLLQLPLVLVQILVFQTGMDHRGGTFWIGSFMSIYLVCTILILVAFYFRGRIGGRSFLILAFLLFIPTTLNESKGTFVLLVVGFLIVMLGANLRRTQVLLASGALVIMLSSFTIIYNMLFDVVGEEGLVSFVAKDSGKGLKHYLYSGEGVEVDPETVLDSQSDVVGARPFFSAEEFKARRIDVMILPLRVLSEDPVRLLLGLGIGNASLSKVDLFSGKYSFLDEYDIFGNLISRFLWEIGLLGLLLYLLFFTFIFRDARHLAQNCGFTGAFALGWAGVVGIVILTLPYKNIFVSEPLSVLFWYLSGCIAAKNYAMKDER